MEEKKLTPTQQLKKDKAELTKELKNKDKEVSAMKAEMDELKQMMQSILAGNNTTVQSKEEENEAISASKYIKITSLYDGKLNLSTEGFGKGRVYTFNKFGDGANIIFSHVESITHNNNKFATEGLFYIHDARAVRDLGLEEVYKNILTIDLMRTLLDKNILEIDEVFKHASESQREQIINILVAKMVNGEEVDLNKIATISKTYGRDIMEMVKDAKFLKETTANIMKV